MGQRRAGPFASLAGGPLASANLGPKNHTTASSGRGQSAGLEASQSIGRPPLQAASPAGRELISGSIKGAELEAWQGLLRRGRN